MMRLAQVLLVVFFAVPAFAAGPDVLAVCEEELPTTKDEPARVILPCAVADLMPPPSGEGASCADATFYVVTADGEVLCEIALPVLAPVSTPSVERAPALPTSTGSSSWAAPSALTGEGARLPLPYVFELAAVAPSSTSRPADGHVRPPPVPS